MSALIESTDKFDNYTFAVHCSDEGFRIIEASLFKVLRGSTANQLLSTTTNTRTEGFDAWRENLKRYDQRNMSDNNSASAAFDQ